MIIPVLCLLVLHGLLGGIDVLVNHEIIERLPSQAWACKEQALHSARECVFAVLFGSLAWLEWRGGLAFGLVALVLAELGISLWDTLLEDDTRRLPHFERILHVLLFINFGAYSATLAPVMMEWHRMETAFQLVNYGPLSWALSLLALLSFAWGMRDALSYFRLRRLTEKNGNAASMLVGGQAGVR